MLRRTEGKNKRERPIAIRIDCHRGFNITLKGLSRCRAREMGMGVLNSLGHEETEAERLKEEGLLEFLLFINNARLPISS